MPCAQHVDPAEARVSRQDESDQQRTQKLDDLSAITGTTSLAGPGLTVKLSDSIRQPSSPQEAGAFHVHDVDIQLVANALFRPAPKLSPSTATGWSPRRPFAPRAPPSW